MKNRFFITSLAIALPLFSASAQVLDDDNVLGEDVKEARMENRQEEQVVDEARVIDRSSQRIDKTPAKVNETEIRRGSTDVEYTTKRQITQTLLNKEQIPTIEVCQSKADINRMQAKDFKALGFDMNTAERIVQQRQQKGSFKSVEDLSQIQGVSQETLTQVKQDLGVGRAQAQEEN